MASSGRNPKELRDMVSNSQQDMLGMQSNLSKLRALSEDDKTESALLRSRIDEQSQLIMILKQRADEATITTQTLERINNELELFRDSAADDLNMHIKKNRMLDMRFNDLASNHEEMIRIKDDYKRRNVELMNENAKLRADNQNLFSKAIDERDQAIVELEKKFSGAKDRYNSLDSRHRKLEETQRQNEDYYKLEVKDLKKKVEELQERLKGTNAKLNQQLSCRQSADVEATNKIQLLTKEKDDLLELAMSRGKLIQDKQTENKKLQQRIEQMEKSVKTMQEKFEREEAAVNANLQVRKLRAELEEVREMQDESAREFDAYKKHSTSLLKKEKELNEKLRHLVG